MGLEEHKPSAEDTMGQQQQSIEEALKLLKQRKKDLEKKMKRDKKDKKAAAKGAKGDSPKQQGKEEKDSESEKEKGKEKESENSEPIQVPTVVKALHPKKAVLKVTIFF